MELICNTEADAKVIIARINTDLSAVGLCDAGGSYATTYQNEGGYWVVPVVAGFEKYFTEFELSIADKAMDASYKQVLKDRAFGQVILNEFLAENKNTELTLDQDIETMAALMPLKNFLDIGGINRAWELLQTDMFKAALPKERWIKYNALMSDYLGLKS